MYTRSPSAGARGGGLREGTKLTLLWQLLLKQHYCHLHSNQISGGLLGNSPTHFPKIFVGHQERFWLVPR